MASILDINAAIGPICTENLTKCGWSYDSVHHIYTKPIYNAMIHSKFSAIDLEFIRNSGLPNIAFAYISIHWDYPMYRETHERLPLIHVEPKPTFRFGIRGYKSASFNDYDLVEPEYVSDMGMLSVLFDKYVNKFKDEGIPERYFINC
jgi:hypothetical protein